MFTIENQDNFYHVSDQSILVVIMFALKEGLNTQLSLKITRPFSMSIMGCLEQFSQEDMKNILVQEKRAHGPLTHKGRSDDWNVDKGEVLKSVV